MMNDDENDVALVINSAGHAADVTKLSEQSGDSTRQTGVCTVEIICF